MKDGNPRDGCAPGTIGPTCGTERGAVTMATTVPTSHGQAKTAMIAEAPKQKPQKLAMRTTPGSPKRRFAATSHRFRAERRSRTVCRSVPGHPLERHYRSNEWRIAQA
jgi:hypothetical protein